MNTKAGYMSKKCTHEEYYNEILEAAELYKRNPFPKEFIQLCKEELEAGNYHLNSIDACTDKGKEDLINATWDAYGLVFVRRSYLIKVMADRGDYPTISGIVCLTKQRMRQITKNGE